MTENPIDPQMKADVDQTVQNMLAHKQLCEDLSARGWISGAVFDYMVTQYRYVSIRSKQGVVVNDYLPKEWKYEFIEGCSPAADSRSESRKRINFDPRIEADDPDGLIKIVHETGHALQHELNPGKDKKKHEEALILGKKDWDYLLTTLKDLPDDQNRTQVLTRAFNALLELEAEASDFGALVAEALGVNLNSYLDLAINHSLMFYFNDNLPVVAEALTEMTRLQEQDVLGDLYHVKPEIGIANKRVTDSLELQKEVKVGQVLAMANKIQDKK